MIGQVRMVCLLKKSAAIVLLLCLAALSRPAGAVNLGSLNVPASRVPDWYAFDESVYQAAKAWPEFDVTCSSGSCPSGKQPFTADSGLAQCSAVSTGSFGSMSCMISNAPNQSVLYLPPGTYSVGQAMRLRRSNVVVRGAGRAATVLSRAGPGRNFAGGSCGANTGASLATVCSTSWKGGRTGWTGGYAARTTSVQVANATLFQSGGWILLRMSGNTSCEYMDKTLNSGAAADGFVHIARVVNVNAAAGTVNIDRGLRMDYVGVGCTGHEAFVYNPVENVGIEALRLTSNPSVPVCSSSSTCIKFPLVSFVGAVNSWLVDSRLDRVWEMWMMTRQAARIWVQGNDFDNLDESISFNTEGIYVKEGGVDLVYENNTCTGTRVCQKLDNGAEGIVTAYNYMRQSQSRCERAYMAHGHYTREVLVEGNDVNCELMMADSYWGRNGPRITAYRNRNVSTVCQSNRDMITINEDGRGAWFAADDVNIIGNTSRQFGASPVQRNPPCPPSINLPISSLVDGVWLEKNAWWLPGGSFAHGSGNNRSCGTGPNDTCPGTNYNTAAPHPSWNGSYPTSLYRTTAPSWWCQEACPWSPQGIGAFGDDWSAGLCKLPAQIRSEGGTCSLAGFPARPSPPVLLP